MVNDQLCVLLEYFNTIVSLLFYFCKSLIIGYDMKITEGYGYGANCLI